MPQNPHQKLQASLLLIESLITSAHLYISKMEAFEWEQKDDATPFWIHMMAGSCAGITEHISMLPLDNIKTHYQAGSHIGVRKIIRSIYQTGGIKNFYSGSSVLFMGCIPAHAMFFSIYEQAKIFLKCDHDDKTHRFALVGAAATLFHDSIMTPTQVIKQRLQIYRTEVKWITPHELIAEIYKAEGFVSFYRSFGINYLMNVPFSSMIILMNQKLKKWMNVKDDDNHLNYYICGGIAGGLAAVPSTPFDVIKTRLNTQADLNSQLKKPSTIVEAIKYSKQVKTSTVPIVQDTIRYHNLIDTTIKIYQQQGLRGFFSGIKIRATNQAFSSAISWGTYQVVNSYFTNNEKRFY